MGRVRVLKRFPSRFKDSGQPREADTFLGLFCSQWCQQEVGGERRGGGRAIRPGVRRGAARTLVVRVRGLRASPRRRVRVRAHFGGGRTQQACKVGQTRRVGRGAWREGGGRQTAPATRLSFVSHGCGRSNRVSGPGGRARAESSQAMQ